MIFSEKSATFRDQALGIGRRRTQLFMASTKQTTESAEGLAIEALGFVAADPVLLARFLSITGIEASAIRRAAQEPGFLAGVLQFIAAHEPTLIAFADGAGIEPSSVLEAIRALPQGDDRYDAST
jgi:hypothetical protein